MGTVAALGPDVDEFESASGSAWKSMPAAASASDAGRACIPPASTMESPSKGHRANGFTTDGGFAEYAVNHINTLARVPGTMSDAEATLVVTAGTSMYGLTELAGSSPVKAWW